MAKKEIRMVVASEDVASVVDHGADIDTQLKNLTFEDKGIKAKISEFAASEIQAGETSVRLKGNTAVATVSAAEKVSLDAEAETFPEVRKAIDAGLLEGIVERKLGLVVPPDNVMAAVAALKAAGIQATVTESLSVTADAMRRDTASVEQAKAMKALQACTSTEVTYRIKYDKA